jgi:hypothetical protein
MKIAVCISGQPRSLDYSLKEIKANLIDTNNPDVFIHTWYHPDFDNQPFDSTQPQVDQKVGVWNPKTTELIHDVLKPIKTVFDRPRSFEEYSDLPGPVTANQPRMASMYYGIWKANELKKDYESEKGFKYDVVIRTRLDLVYFSPFILENYQIKNYSAAIYVPLRYHHTFVNPSYTATDGYPVYQMADTFFFSSSRNMNRACAVYPNFRYIHSKIKPNNYGEAYLGYNVINLHDFEVRMLPIDYDILYRTLPDKI